MIDKQPGGPMSNPDDEKIIKGTMTLQSELQKIATVITKESLNPKIKDFAVEILSGFHNIRLTYSEARALHEWVRNNIRYVPDVQGWEVITWPLITIDKKYGDCDDMVILLGSLAKSVGFPVGLVTVNLESATDFDHIYLIIMVKPDEKNGTLGGGYFSDPTAKGETLGFEVAPERYTRKNVMWL